MKFSRFVSSIMVFGALSLCLAQVSFADDEALKARGKELFTTKEALGTKLACVLCHQGSKALDPAKVKALGDALPDTINKYIAEKAKGTTLPKDSEDMKALETYLASEQS